MIHHVVFWDDDGDTDLDNGVLVCHRHHSFVHDRNWTLTLDAETRKVTVASPNGAVVRTSTPQGAAAQLAADTNHADSDHADSVTAHTNHADRADRTGSGGASAEPDRSEHDSPQRPDPSHTQRPDPPRPDPPHPADPGRRGPDRSSGTDPPCLPGL